MRVWTAGVTALLAGLPLTCVGSDLMMYATTEESLDTGEPRGLEGDKAEKVLIFEAPKGYRICGFSPFQVSIDQNARWQTGYDPEYPEMLSLELRGMSGPAWDRYGSSIQMRFAIWAIRSDAYVEDKSAEKRSGHYVPLPRNGAYACAPEVAGLRGLLGGTTVVPQEPGRRPDSKSEGWRVISHPTRRRAVEWKALPRLLTTEEAKKLECQGLTGRLEILKSGSCTGPQGAGFGGGTGVQGPIDQTACERERQSTLASLEREVGVVGCP